VAGWEHQLPVGVFHVSGERARALEVAQSNLNRLKLFTAESAEYAEIQEILSALCELSGKIYGTPMNLSDLTLLYDYNYWANERMLSMAAGVSQAQFAEPGPHSHGGLRGTLLHTLDTEYGWRLLCQHGQITLDVSEDEFPTVEALAARWREEEKAMRAYLASLTDAALLGVVRYEAQGAQRERVLWHCLWHVVNHGTQHRAETAHILTHYGASPGDVDFTLYLRTRG